jgi:hypothetical protein
LYYISALGFRKQEQKLEKAYKKKKTNKYDQKVDKHERMMRDKTKVKKAQAKDD